MSRVRLLVGTRKGAFVIESDGTRKQWDVSGPHFGGWELYHLKGSPADPNRIWASPSSGWFGTWCRNATGICAIVASLQPMARSSVPGLPPVLPPVINRRTVSVCRTSSGTRVLWPWPCSPTGPSSPCSASC